MVICSLPTRQWPNSSFEKFFIGQYIGTCHVFGFKNGVYKLFVCRFTLLSRFEESAITEAKFKRSEYEIKIHVYVYLWLCFP